MGSVMKRANLLSTMSILALSIMPSIAAAQTTNYTYDAQGRLTGSVAGTGGTTSYKYDAAGNRQSVVAINAMTNSWVGQSPALGHIIGFADADGWAANVNTQPNNYLVYGPYTPVAAGSHVAGYKILVDNNDNDNLSIALLEINDADKSTSLGSLVITRTMWSFANSYQLFTIPFTVPAANAGDRLEFRVYYYGHAYVRVGAVGYG